MFSNKKLRPTDSVISGLSEEKIKHLAEDSALYQRGFEYFEYDAVGGVVKSDNHIQAYVTGAQGQKYTIKISLDNHTIIGKNCSCPYDGNCCKHIVATLLECLYRPENVLQINYITDSLQALDASQLRTLVKTLLKNNPDLYQKVMIEIDVLNKTLHDYNHEGANNTCSSIINPKLYKQSIRTAFRETKGCCYQSGGWDGQDLINQCFGVIEKAEQFAANNDGNNALLILEAVMDEFIQGCDHLEHIYDDEGDVASSIDEILSRLSTAWCEAILIANLSPDAVKRLSMLMEEWEEQLNQCEIDFLENNSYYFAPILLALREGWHDKTLHSILAGNTKEVANDLNDEENTVVRVRLKILRRQNRIQEYINLSKYTQFIPELVEVLLVEHRAEEAFTYANNASMNIKKLLMVAKKFAAAGKSTYAIEIARKGIILNGHELEALELGEWLSSFAESCNYNDIALQAAQLSFTASPTLQRYKSVLRLAPSHTSEQLKKDLINSLKNNHNIYFPENVIEVLLYENLIAEAIDHVDKHRGFCIDEKTIKKVMEAAISCNAQWVINKGDKYATSIISSGNASKYCIAIDFLQLVHKAYIAIDKASEWNLYLNKLRTEQKSKRKLMALCNEAF